MYIYIYIYICPYIYIITEHKYTDILRKEEYINYTENRESMPRMTNTDLTGKYHVKVTFSWKPSDDPMVSTVILPVAPCFKHARKQKF